MFGVVVAGAVVVIAVIASVAVVAVVVVISVVSGLSLSVSRSHCLFDLAT